MALVDYASSDESEAEQHPKVTAPPNSKGNPNKPAFQKLVDHSNPSKIRVSLPEPTRDRAKDAEDGSEPPAKRTKTGPGSFGGFNSFLPAPKRAAATATGAAKGGLGRGVNLKTGAAPGFTREPIVAPQSYRDDFEGSEEPTVDTSTIADKTEEKSRATSSDTANIGVEGVPNKKASIFKPLSVSRKPQKKKSAPANSESKNAVQKSDVEVSQPKAAPKMSLFSVKIASETPSSASSPIEIYRPMVYQSDRCDAPALTSSNARGEPESLATSRIEPMPTNTNPPDSLDSIAADLNLSASARRQLLGRNQRDGRNSSIKITNFNTDEEYAANEVLRQSGETIQHNPVRGVAPGKHSLKQLVNAATTQKDALEEQFAAGRRNKSEAGAKYGW